MANLTGDYFKLLLVTKHIDFGADTFKIALMASGFVFNRATHRKWSDASANEIANGNGYTTNGATLALTGSTPAEDNTSHLAKVQWANPSWTASGGSIGPSAGAIVYDDTHTDKPVVLWIPFSPEQTQAAGGVFTIIGVEYDQVDTVTPD